MTTKSDRKVPETYFKLIRRFPLRRIANDEDLAAALGVIDDLLKLELDGGEEIYLSALSTLVQAYENENHPIPDATPAEVLRELSAVNGLNGTALSQRSGIAQSTVSALLSGKRRPTPEQMTALAGVFSVNPAVFLPIPVTVRKEKPWRGAPKGISRTKS